MACFEFLITFKNAIINTLTTFSIKEVTVSKDTTDININRVYTEPTINVGCVYPLITITRVEPLEVCTTKVGTFSIKTDVTRLVPDIQIAIVCDINYGIPLYAPDGRIYTIDGKAVYVRSAKLEDYEGE